MPPIWRDLYDNLVEQLQLAGQPVPATPNQVQAEQTAAELPASWDDIAVGHLVIAHESAAEGWWEAIVVSREGDMVTLKWRDYPWQSNVIRHVATVALMKRNVAAA